jgi:hypothetical protein
LYKIEKEIILLFNNKYKKRTDIGNEYYMGDYEEMINDINIIIQTERKNNKKEFNVENIYFNDIEKFICDKTSKKNNSFIQKNEVNYEFVLWYKNNYNIMPTELKINELYCEMDKKYNKYNGYWKNCLIIYDNINIDDNKNNIDDNKNNIDDNNELNIELM